MEKNESLKNELSQEDKVEKEEQPSAIQEILERAVLDEDFKQELMDNPDQILDQYDLSETGRIMIKSLNKEDLDHLTPENLEEYFAADSAIYTPDFDKDMPVEYFDEEDL